MTTRIDAIIDIKLVWPYKHSLMRLEHAANLWHVHILSSGSNRETAVVAFPWIVYKRIFRRNPTRQKLDVPVKLREFITAMNVIGIRVMDVK